MVTLVTRARLCQTSANTLPILTAAVTAVARSVVACVNQGFLARCAKYALMPVCSLRRLSVVNTAFARPYPGVVHCVCATMAGLGIGVKTARQLKWLPLTAYV